MTTEHDHKSDHQPLHKIYLPLPKLMLDNFLSGISWGVGSVIGATVVVAILGIIIARSSQLPLLGQIIEVITAEIQQSQLKMQSSPAQLPSPTPSSTPSTQ